MTARLAIVMMKLALILVWPSVCWAASITLSTTINQLTPGVFMIVFALSTLAGVTALVMRIDRELRAMPGQPLPRPYLFVACHMLPSWLAGLLAFFICESQNVGDWVELILIVLSAFTGSRSIEAAVEQYLKRQVKGKSQ
jgi:LydA holin phage, holin superfamily III